MNPRISKHVEDVRNKNINFGNCAFGRRVLCSGEKDFAVTVVKDSKYKRVY